jgi:hypothetical protein
MMVDFRSPPGIVNNFEPQLLKRMNVGKQFQNLEITT